MFKVGTEVITKDRKHRGVITYLEGNHVEIEQSNGATVDFDVNSIEIYVKPEPAQAPRSRQFFSKYPAVMHVILNNMILNIPSVIETIEDIDINDPVYGEILKAWGDQAVVAKRFADMAIDVDPEVSFIFGWDEATTYQKCAICSYLFSVKVSKMVTAHREGSFGMVRLIGLSSIGYLAKE